jgi:hypothetical protein
VAQAGQPLSFVAATMARDPEAVKWPRKKNEGPIGPSIATRSLVGGSVRKISQARLGSGVPRERVEAVTSIEPFPAIMPIKRMVMLAPA